MSFQPAFGQLFTLFPIKALYIASIVVFEIGSTISASAPSSVAFIIGRLISGAAGGGLWCGTLTLMGKAVPARKRHLYVSCSQGCMELLQLQVLCLVEFSQTRLY